MEATPLSIAAMSLRVFPDLTIPGMSIRAASPASATLGMTAAAPRPLLGHAAARRLGLGERWWEEIGQHTTSSVRHSQAEPECYVPSSLAREAHDIVRTRDADAALALLHRALRERLI